MRADALPTKSGGGIVFPDGFLGGAFRLPEAAFHRFCAGEQENGNPMPPRRNPLVPSGGMGIFLCFLIGALAAAMLAMNLSGVLGSRLASRLVDALFVVAFFALYASIVRSWVTSRKRMTADFPSAEAATCSFWRAQVFAAVMARPRAWAWLPGMVFVVALLPVAHAWRLQDSLPYGGIITTFFAVVAAGAALWSAAFFLAAQQLGRAPTAADIDAALEGERKSAETEEGPSTLIIVPAGDGSGVVYPDGHFGFGYLMSANDLERCSASASLEREATLGHSEALRVLAVSLGVILLTVSFVWLMTELEQRELTTRSAAAFVGVLVIYGVVLRAWTTGLLLQPGRIRNLYPSARKLRYWSHWQQRVLATTLHKDWKHTYLWLPAIGGWAFYAFIAPEYRQGQVSPYCLYLALGLGVYFALRGAALLITLWAIRLRLGRSPTGEDLESV